MVDCSRVLAKLEEFQGYLDELRALVPANLAQYRNTPTKRACERLLQLCVESTIDISKKLVIGNKLGIPSDEADVFEKLRQADILSADMLVLLKKMRGVRNILVHEYTDVDDELIMEVIMRHLGDFERFKTEVLAYLNK